MNTDTTTFALRTDDAAWIARNHGTIDEAGRVLVQVAADETEQFDRMGRPWIRTVFADIPSDALNAVISCPAAWVAGKVIHFHTVSDPANWSCQYAHPYVTEAEAAEYAAAVNEAGDCGSVTVVPCRKAA